MLKPGACAYFGFYCPFWVHKLKIGFRLKFGWPRSKCGWTGPDQWTKWTNGPMDQWTDGPNPKTGWTDGPMVDRGAMPHYSFACGPIHHGDSVMTKKHFVELAKAISAIMDQHARLQAASAVAGVASKLNPRVDAQRFFAACGVNP